MNPLIYSDKVPTLPGWYWERRASGSRILELNKHNMPRSWRGSKARLLVALKKCGAGKEAITHTASLPASHWRVEYAGPIQEPTP